MDQAHVEITDLGPVQGPVEQGVLLSVTGDLNDVDLEEVLLYAQFGGAGHTRYRPDGVSLDAATTTPPTVVPK